LHSDFRSVERLQELMREFRCGDRVGAPEFLLPINGKVAPLFDEICRLWRSTPMFERSRWLAKFFAGAVMNPWSGRCLLGACALAILVTACSSDSTGPKSSDLAIYYDSLYEHLDLPGQLNPLLDLRGNILSNIELAIAFGAIPRAVSVTTTTGVEHWQGVEFVTNPNGTQFEFDHTLIVYRETDAHNALMVKFGKDGSAILAILEVADTMVSVPYTLSGSSGVKSQSVGCATPPMLANPAIGSYQLGSCATATFTTSISEHLDAIPGLDPTLTTIEFAPTVFAGEVFTSGFGDFRGRINGR
jgi:hypothetical protein